MAPDRGLGSAEGAGLAYETEEIGFGISFWRNGGAASGWRVIYSPALSAMCISLVCTTSVGLMRHELGLGSRLNNLQHSGLCLGCRMGKTKHYMAMPYTYKELSNLLSGFITVPSFDATASLGVNRGLHVTQGRMRTRGCRKGTRLLRIAEGLEELTEFSHPGLS